VRTVAIVSGCKGARFANSSLDVLSVGSSLDSSLKKNTAFIKRLRTGIASATATTCLQEIRTLSLHKYLSEIIAASYEGLCKLKSPAEIAAGVEIVSGLHQRFGPTEYTCYLGWLLGRGLSTPDKALLKTLSPEAKDKEEKERLSRQRVLLKVVTELWLVGLLRSLEDVVKPEDAAVRGKDAGGPTSKEAAKPKSATAPARNVDTEAFPLEVLKDLLGHDREHSNLTLVVLFVKSFAYDVLGVKSSSEKGTRQSVEADGATTVSGDGDWSTLAEEGSGMNDQANDPPLISLELQQRFRGVLERYLEDVKAHVIKDQKAIATQGRKNAEAYVKSGEVFEDRQANYDKLLKTQERLVSNTQILCDALGSEMPDLAEKDNAEAANGGGIGLVKTGEYLRGHTDGAGIWEDEEERRFYENIVDLKDRVPGVLLEEPKKKKVDDDRVGKRNDADKPSSPEPTTDDQSMAIANKTVGAQVDSILARLPEMQTKDAVDQTAIDFCFLNSKASRNRLVKAVQEVPKGRSDLLPIYSRLVATLSKYLPDVAQGLVSYLDDEFRSLQRRKSKEFLGQVRTGNIRYLAELTKFGVVPEHVIFHCLKVCLDDFSRMNIEIIANLLENCGRYLLRNPETSPRMKSFLETLQRKKAAHHLAQQERMLIENAMYYVNPPVRAAIQQKERTPTDLYVRKLIYTDMNKRTYTRILKSIRKLHWEEPEVVDVLRKVFSKPGKVKYSNIHLLAILVGALYRYHQDFVVSILDAVLEQIVLGLEQNDFKFNQRRISEVKYLGELYNYKMVDSPIIFDTMYRIVTFGHPTGTPTPGRHNPLDPSDDFFRIRLVCTVLDTCGTCFDRGLAKKKLDFFLTFFQYYLKTKDPLPMDIEFVVQDAFALIRPQWKVATDLEEAGRLFAEAVQQNYKIEENDKAVEQEEPEDEASSEDGDDDLPAGEIDEQASSSDEAEVDNAGQDGPKPDSDFEEDIVVTRQAEERDPEADAEFDRELAKMMSEGTEARKPDRKPVFDVPLPMRRPLRDATNTSEEAAPSGTITPPNTMAFALMTKKGNKQQVCSAVVIFRSCHANSSRLAQSSYLQTLSLLWP
jgi:regulator of nonsense transcripts 2